MFSIVIVVLFLLTHYKIKIIPKAQGGKHCKGTFHARLLVATEKLKLKKSMPVVLGRSAAHIIGF